MTKGKMRNQSGINQSHVQPSANIRHQPSALRLPTPRITPPTSVLRHPTSGLRPPPSTLPPPLDAGCWLLDVRCNSQASGIWHPASAQHSTLDTSPRPSHCPTGFAPLSINDIPLNLTKSHYKKFPSKTAVHLSPLNCHPSPPWRAEVQRRRLTCPLPGSRASPHLRCQNRAYLVTS
jgi:hypothetical protein